MAPLIGLNMSLMDMDSPLKEKAFCHLAYIDAVAGAGGIPILIPPYGDLSMLEKALAPLDGFCLIGGPDYLPSSYGGHPQPESDLVHERRHHFDLALAEILLKKSKKPVLGVCGGQQLISLAMGGALVQDLRTEWQPTSRNACTLLHSNDERKATAQEGNVYRHEIRIEPQSQLAKILGCTKVLANSYHHQAVHPDRVGEGVIVSAVAPDGVIEAIEFSDPERFVIGVQWHPERQQDEAEHRAIFQALINRSAKKESVQ